MAATATASSVRYAPEDPTLPKPWRGLVDGKTGYLYYWNPETNVTQYERPVSSLFAEPTTAHKSLSSSVHVSKSSQGTNRETSPQDDSNIYNKGETAFAAKFSSGTGSYQAARMVSDLSRDVPNATIVDVAAKEQSSLIAGSSVSPESYRHRHEISVTGENVPPPLTSFDSTGFPSEILREVRYLLQGGAKCRTLCSLSWGLAYVFGVPLFRGPILVKGFPNHQVRGQAAVGDDSVCHLVQLAGFSAPTPIQAQSWPIALQGRDIVAIAKTGSGKTLGYLIPGFIHLKRRRNNPQLGPTVLVLSPTRELATQIQDEAIKFGKSSRISCTCLYGGAPKGPQLKELDRGTDIVVATPGRLNDILEMRRVSLDQVSYLVLDEADRMLDMGFEPQIRKIVKEVPTRRQTLMYTATWPKEVRKIAADLLINPVQVNIGNVDELVANKSITQYVELLPPMEKHRRLEQILRSQEPGSKIIIFCSTKKMCDQLARNLTRQFGAAAIHGDKSQSERDFVLNQFRNGRSPVLVATDVAARGLDIKDIRVVINYDFPTGVEDYVHRIGRTGRAGACGVAYTFFGDQDAKYASDLVKVLEGANQRVPVEIRDMALRGGGIGRSRRQWGSGPGGHDGGRGPRYDSSYSGRDGGRGGWSASYSDRGYGRGNDRDLRDRYGRSLQDADAPGSYPYRSFHETMTRVAEKRNRSRSRSRSRSPNRGSGWGDSRNRGRSRSRSTERYEQGPHACGRSFHESMMQRARSPPPSGNQHLSSFSGNKSREYNSGSWSSRSPDHGGQRENVGGSYDKDRLQRQPSPVTQCDNQAEEGMIQAEEGINASG